ncbi:MAG: hypothetical protein M1819_006471 [Sarea resinae]|nr:MAG: hypothetical protein M1819_006471 [Sarea resinae]
MHTHHLNSGASPLVEDDPHSFSKDYAEKLDAADPLTRLREEFLIPSKADLLSQRLPTSALKERKADSEPCVYLCGNSLGLQPRRTSERLKTHLETWATKGAYGHFKQIEDSPLPPWVDIDDAAAEKIASVVGASPSEVAVMETLTANLHLLMASFYQPTKERHKIILEGKAFPSDHYAIESQIRHHNLSPSTSMIQVTPDPTSSNPCLPTSRILSIIDEHASSTSLILFPGIQFYTGQLFDIPTITAHAHAKGILVGWDLAHAVGNVELHLHDWDVDFAVWCNYKYMNSGPGAIGGLYVHERHGRVDTNDQTGLEYRPRLSGWWGGDKAARFRMDNKFVPIPGAAGYQLSNPSTLDLTAVLASLEIFNSTSMSALRARSIRLTNHLEALLLHLLSALPPPSSASPPPSSSSSNETPPPLFSIITPPSPEERGAQLSIRLANPAHLSIILAHLEREGVVVDERKPDVIRVAPAPLYNSFVDVWEFVRILGEACRMVLQG